MKEHVHFIGIGGTGISAIARLMLEEGYFVSGSDRALTPLASSLQDAGVKIFIGHDPNNISGAHWVIRSSAIPDDNPEVLSARSRGIPVYKRSDFLGRLMQPPKIGVAVAGTHGKTTTTAMIAFILLKLGLDPSYIIGANLLQGNNAHAGNGQAFVIEADEYDRMFLGLRPTIAVITNIEHDHPDIYPTQSDYVSAFEQFSQLVPNHGALIADGTNPGVQRLISNPSLLSTRKVIYGIDPTPEAANERIIGSPLKNDSTDIFSYNVQALIDNRSTTLTLRLRVPGIHNFKNALAALAACALLGVPLEDAANALFEFTGTDRRFNIYTLSSGVTIINDYAHHPTEIQATLNAAHQKFPNSRVWAIWQPHTYSRTKTLLQDFSKSFSIADRVIISKIYASREAQQAFSSAQVVEQMRHPAVEYIPELDEITETLQQLIRPGDVIVVMSAGDADQIVHNLIEKDQIKRVN